MVSAVLIPVIKASTGTWEPELRDMPVRPTWAESTEVATARLIAWPVKRMVDRIAAATPYRLFSTELMVALVLGELKKAWPVPSAMSLKAMFHHAEAAPSTDKARIDAETIAMPMEAMILGSILSESHPPRGEKAAIMTG